MTQIAVVILNYNGAKLLKQFLPSVIQHSPEASIYVADNGSSDDSVQILKSDFPSVKLILLERNFGFCGGYNKSLQQIQATYYVLLNSDVEVSAGWLTPMLDLFADETVSAVQPKILSYNSKNTFEYAGAGGGFIDSLGYPFCRGRLFDFVEKDHGQYNDTRQVFWTSGACLLIRGSDYHQFGGLDEDLFAHMEEIDLCWKINRANLKVMYCGASTVYHLGAGTLGYANPRKTFLNFRNGLTLVYKHWKAGEMLYKLPIRMMLDWLAAFTFLLKGSWPNCKAVFSAHAAFLRDLKIHKRKRKALQQTYPGYPTTQVYKGVIVFDFFIRKKKMIKA